MKHKIIEADVLGFCSGVKLAMGIAVKAREENPTKKIFTFGELIHNSEAIKFLESKRIFALDKNDALSTEKDHNDSIIIVCAHGIEIKDMEILQKNFAVVMNATCPHVLQSQKKAQSYASQNYEVILIGEKEHQEVLSIKSYVELVKGSKCIVIENEKDAKVLSLNEADLPICTIGQTTLKQTEYNSIVEVLANKVATFLAYTANIKKSTSQTNKIFQVLNTICPATQKRQDALFELAKNCDAILVVGGKNSTNTKRLFQTALNLQANSFLIENESEIPESIFQFETIGITAGASTPDFVLDAIKKKLMQ